MRRGNGGRAGERGFSLIELMIVVAIIGVLASAAIPAFMRYIRRARDVEGVHNLHKLFNGARAYFDTHQVLPNSGCTATSCSGSVCAPAVSPTTIICTHAGVYPPSVLAEFKHPIFNQHLFSPEGNIRFRYWYSGFTPRGNPAGLTGTYSIWRQYKCAGGAHSTRVLYWMILSYGAGTVNRGGPWKRLY